MLSLTHFLPKKENLAHFAAALLVVALVLLLIPASASANQSTFCVGNQTNAATSSPSYMTPGTATTTLSNDKCVGDPSIPLDSLAIELQFHGSSTASTLQGGIEQSMDGIDWYAVPTNIIATTSPSWTLDSNGRFSWTFASSTPGGGAVAANTSRIMKVLEIPTFLRYTRVWIGTTGANAAVWGQFIGQRQALAR